jgi:saccharopine dehydrogenase-like NADP-dependent oxidoreductase
MVEKTLRYPGHADAMRGLRESGFFQSRSIEADGASVSPRAVTERLLSGAWKLREGEEEFTYLRVSVVGQDASGAAKTCAFELLDRPGPGGATSMARTTGFPCSVAAAMLARGQYRDPGVRPLELVAANPGASLQFLEGLRARGLVFQETWL